MAEHASISKMRQLFAEKVGFHDFLMLTYTPI